MTKSEASQKLFNAHPLRNTDLDRYGTLYFVVYLCAYDALYHIFTRVVSVSINFFFLKIWKENRFNLHTKKLRRNVRYRSQRRFLIPLPKDYRDYFFSPYQKSHLITGKVTMYLLGDLWKKKKNRKNSILCYF